MARLFVFETLIGVGSILFFVPTYIFALLYTKKDRPFVWRQASRLIIKIATASARVKINAPKVPHDRNFVYASNHPTDVDGFVLQWVLGAEAIPLVAPLAQFPSLVRGWMRNMGAIEVLRDDVDIARYPGANTKKQALHKCLQALREGHSIMIFPEGHVEHLDAVYYFHTGAARISLASGVPIQPVVTKDSHRVFANNLLSTRRTVTVELLEPIVPDRAYGESILFTPHLALRKKVREMTDELEDSILSSIPVRQLKDQRVDENHIGVFVDIDMTIYHGLSQVDFLLELMREKRISKRDVFAVMRMFVLEKAGLKSHQALMNKALGLLSGWHPVVVEKLSRRFFRSIALPKIEYGLYAVLQDHLAKGHHVVFVSEVMHPLAKAFTEFFAADGAVDTSLRRRGKTYTGEIAFLCRGQNKADGVLQFAKEHHLELAESYAYADSYTDMNFLSLVGHPMAVNPDRKLKKLAFSKGVQILPAS